MHDASYLNHRGVSFAVFCEGPWEEIEPFREFMGYTLPWYSMLEVEDRGVGTGLIDEPGYIACYLRIGDRVFLTNETVGRGVEATMVQAHLLDLTVYGRQEAWEDSPAGWRRIGPTAAGRKTAASSRNGPGLAPHHSTNPQHRPDIAVDEVPAHRPQPTRASARAPTDSRRFRGRWSSAGER